MADDKQRGQKRPGDTTYNKVTTKLIKTSPPDVGDSSVKSDFETIMGNSEVRKGVLDFLSISDLENLSLTSKVMHATVSTDGSLIVNRAKNLGMSKQLMKDPQLKELNKIVDSNDENAILKLAIDNLTKIKKKTFIEKLTLSDLVILSGHRSLLENRFNNHHFSEKEKRWIIQFAPLETIKYLVERHREPITENSLILACSNDSPEIMDYLIALFLPNNPIWDERLVSTHLQALTFLAVDKDSLNLVNYFARTWGIPASTLNMAAKAGSLANLKQALVVGKDVIDLNTWFYSIMSANLDTIQFVEGELSKVGFTVDYTRLKDSDLEYISKLFAVNCDNHEVISYLKEKKFNFIYCLSEAARCGNDLLFSSLFEDMKIAWGRKFEERFAEENDDLLDMAVAGGNIAIIEKLSFIVCTPVTLCFAIESGVVKAVEWVCDNLEIESFESIAFDEEKILNSLNMMSAIADGPTYERICEIVEEVLNKVNTPGPQM